VGVRESAFCIIPQISINTNGEKFIVQTVTVSPTRFACGLKLKLKFNLKLYDVGRDFGFGFAFGFGFGFEFAFAFPHELAGQ